MQVKVAPESHAQPKCVLTYSWTAHKPLGMHTSRISVNWLFK